MNFVKVKFTSNGIESMRSYTYRTELELHPGDIVKLSSSGQLGIVVDEPVDMDWVERYGAENLKCIVGKVEKTDVREIEEGNEFTR